MIAFVGSVFSPYYHWAGRRDPDNHVCINVALYRPSGNRWSMTERGRGAMRRDANSFTVGPSSIRRENGEIVIDFDEVSVPRPPAQLLPRRIKGRIRFSPDAVTSRVFDIDGKGRHRWWPVSPIGRIAVEMARGGENWSGHGYMDSNWGTEPLEKGFTIWDWARGLMPNGDAVILYDAAHRGGGHGRIALRIASDGTVDEFAMPDKTALSKGVWGVPRAAHHDGDDYAPTRTKIVRTLEDGPFYTRSVIRTRLFGEDIDLMHESLSGDRFASPVVKAMLPFRMPRRR
ncbi:MAG: carotenoid 1,2-hydratase [Hoeflea sp.]|uniref:carotenoid 1,2-hydratase n=1 Tax=Hoeflea sp. TaxID=1940281 RepID=UPI0032EFC6C2